MQIQDFDFSRWFLVILSVFALESANASDYQSPRTLSLGGAGHAAPLQTDPIVMNASHAAFLPAYQVTAAFQRYKGSTGNQEPRGRVATFAVLDGNQTTVPIGLLYSRRAQGAILALGGGYKINEAWSVGLSAKTTLKTDTLTDNRDFSTSATYRLSKAFQFALITDNVIQNRTKANPWGQFREYTLGTKYALDKNFFFYLDPHYTPARDKKFGYEAGVEVATFSDLYIRVGKSMRSMQPHLAQYGDSLGYGFGYVGPRFSMDFAISHAETTVKTRSLVASITLMF